MQGQPTTLALLRAALECIGANLPRDEWARVAMAIKSEFPDSEGLELFDEWSATGDAYDSANVKSTWQSIKPGGGVGVGTLFKMAKRGGFDIAAQRRTLQPSLGPQAPRQYDRKERAEKDAQQRQQAHEQAAIEAAALWEAGTETGQSAYLERKGVRPHGVRFTVDGVVLVPLRDAAGKLWNVQRIAPCKPSNGGPDKLFGKGGRKSGLFHLLGDVGTKAPGLVLLAEGYATGASLHEATGYTVAVAFDAGNLGEVAKALHQLAPLALLVVCGDDDTQTQANTGNNPGRAKATAAANSVGGLAVFPSALPEGGSDFNDMHQCAGLEAVALVVNAAIEAVKNASALETTPIIANDTPKAEKPASPRLDRFNVEDGGVWFNGIDQDGKPKPAEWVCSRLEVTARTREQDGNEWGYLLAFADPLGKPKQWAMPARMLSGDGGEYRTVLLSMGLLIGTSSRARNLLTQYIQTREPEEFASCTAKIGWHSGAYVLPHKSIGGDGEKVVYQTDAGGINTFSDKRTVFDWASHVGALCAGNSRLVFAVSCAFAGPMLHPAGIESGGFHFRGESGTGKTTMLEVAASVYGPPSFMQRWRTTDNALEAVAVQHNDCLLILDELDQVDAKTAGDCAYMLANGQGKSRATRTGTPRPSHTWRLLFLSSGELSLAQHMETAQKKVKAGQEVRMVDMPADAGAGLGALECLHGRPDGSAFVNEVKHNAGAAYGSVGIAWIEYLCKTQQGLRGRVKEAIEAFYKTILPTGASGQVARVCRRFALVAVAGEMATAAGLTGWEPSESEHAAKACFFDWLKARGGNGNGEVSAILRAVKVFIERNGAGRFTWWHRGADDHAANTMQRAGYRRLLNVDGEPIKSNSQHFSEFGDKMPPIQGAETSVEYFILSETFKSEVCAGFDPVAVSKVLLDHGVLLPDKGRQYDCKPRLPGLGNTRCYRISPTILELDI